MVLRRRCLRSYEWTELKLRVGAAVERERTKGVGAVDDLRRRPPSDVPTLQVPLGHKTRGARAPRTQGGRGTNSQNTRRQGHDLPEVRTIQRQTPLKGTW